MQFKWRLIRDNFRKKKALEEEKKKKNEMKEICRLKIKIINNKISNHLFSPANKNKLIRTTKKKKDKIESIIILYLLSYWFYSNMSIDRLIFRKPSVSYNEKSIEEQENGTACIQWIPHSSNNTGSKSSSNSSH